VVQQQTQKIESNEKNNTDKQMIYNQELINNIKAILVERSETIAVAESVTAGHLQAALSVAIEASKFFQGGITTYNLGQKARHLHIDPILGENVNCVHRKIAETMAIEVSKMFSSHIGIGITGYASKVPEGDDELFAYFCIVNDGEVMILEKLTAKEKHPYDVQIDYANQVIQQLHLQLTKRD
jgi:PncC family amidohydrolase